MKIEIFPEHDRTGSTSSGFYSFQRASRVNIPPTITSGDGNMQTWPDYKSYADTRGKIKMYYKVGKYFKSINETWVPPLGPLYGEAATLLRMQGEGLTVGKTYANVKITYYC